MNGDLRAAEAAGAAIREAVSGARPGKRMKADPEMDAAADAAYGVAARDLKEFVDRLIRLNAHRAEIGDDIKAVVAEAKAKGYDTKALKYVVKYLEDGADGRAARAEFEAVVAMYKAALGV